MNRKLALPELVLDYHRLILHAETNKSIARWSHDYSSRKAVFFLITANASSFMTKIQHHFIDLRRPEVTNSEMERIDTYFVVKSAAHKYF